MEGTPSASSSYQNSRISHNSSQGFHSSHSSHSSQSALANRHGYSGYGIPAFFAARRHKKVLSDNLRAGINKPTIRRLARRGGIIRIKSDIYPTVQEIVRERLKLLIKRAIELVLLADRKTMTALDVVYALRSFGTPIYGFGVIEKGENIADHAARYREKKRRQAENRERVARLNASHSATQIDVDVQTIPNGDVNAGPQQRELHNQRIDGLMRQMKRGARC